MPEKQKFIHKENKGSLFENDHKQTEKHPDFRGTINVNGVIYWISAWKDTTGEGKKRLNLSVQPQEQREDVREEPRQSRPTPARARQSAW